LHLHAATFANIGLEKKPDIFLRRVAPARVVFRATRVCAALIIAFARSKVEA
jgi:hypothetical protein